MATLPTSWLQIFTKNQYNVGQSDPPWYSKSSTVHCSKTSNLKLFVLMAEIVYLHPISLCIRLSKAFKFPAIQVRTEIWELYKKEIEAKLWDMNDTNI